MDDFIDAPKQKDLKKIRACPKGDLHDHFVLGEAGGTCGGPQA